MSREILGEGWAPYIVRVPETGQFRIYHHQRNGANLQVVMRSSPDGTAWASPVVVRSQVEAAGASWGSSVIDRGAGVSDPAKRFKNIHYWIGPGTGGAYVDNSTDGLVWEAPSSRVTPVVVSDDQLNPFTLPGGGYGLFTKHDIPSDPFPRETWVSLGDADFKNWSTPVKAFWRDPMDPPDLEFYGATQVLVRGDWLITFLRVLRDDVERGKGYTVLAWAHKDRPTIWTRSREPFFTGCPATDDQAHAWIYGVVEHSGTIYFSYSAYADGHKVGPRLVGIATMPSADLEIGVNNGPGC